MPEESLEQQAAYDNLREAVVKLCADPKESSRSIASSLAYSQKRNWSKIFTFEKETLGPSFDRIHWKSVVVMRLTPPGRFAHGGDRKSDNWKMNLATGDHVTKCVVHKPRHLHTHTYTPGPIASVTA